MFFDTMRMKNMKRELQYQEARIRGQRHVITQLISNLADKESEVQTLLVQTHNMQNELNKFKSKKQPSKKGK